MSVTPFPDCWRIADLDVCVEILDSLRVPVNSEERSERIAGKSDHELFPYYGATGQVGVIDGYLFDEELVALGEDGVPFLDAAKPKAYKLAGKTWVNNHAHVLKAVDGLTTNEFILHYLNQFDYHGYVNGGTRLKLTQANMRRIPVPIPALAEQKQIAAKLDELLAQVDTLKARLDAIPAILKRFRQSVLAAAVSGRLTEDWREHHEYDGYAQVEALRARVSSKRQNSELARFHELPPTWAWALVKEVGEVQLGRQRAPQYHSGNKMRPYLRVANVMEGHLDLSDVMEMHFDDDEYERYKLESGDILLNEGQSHELVGRSAIYRGEIDAAFTNTLIRFRPKSPLWGDFAHYVFLCYLKSSRFQQIASRTVNISHLGAGRFADMEFPFPPAEEQAEIVLRVDQLFAFTDQIEQRVKAAQARVNHLTQAILAKAFRGELTAEWRAQNPDLISGENSAEALLARIRAERATAAKPRGGRYKTAALDGLPMVAEKKAAYKARTKRKSSAQA